MPRTDMQATRDLYSCAIVDCINNRDRINSAVVSESKLIRSKYCFPTIEFLGFVCTACCYWELKIVTLNVTKRKRKQYHIHNMFVPF